MEDHSVAGLSTDDANHMRFRPGDLRCAHLCHLILHRSSRYAVLRLRSYLDDSKGYMIATQLRRIPSPVPALPPPHRSVRSIRAVVDSSFVMTQSSWSTDVQNVASPPTKLA